MYLRTSPHFYSDVTHSGFTQHIRLSRLCPHLRHPKNLQIQILRWFFAAASHAARGAGPHLRRHTRCSGSVSHGQLRHSNSPMASISLLCATGRQIFAGVPAHACVAVTRRQIYTTLITGVRSSSRRAQTPGGFRVFTACLACRREASAQPQAIFGPAQ